MKNCANQFIKTKYKFLHLSIRTQAKDYISSNNNVSRQMVFLRKLDTIAELLVDDRDVLLWIIYP